MKTFSVNTYPDPNTQSNFLCGTFVLDILHFFTNCFVVVVFAFPPSLWCPKKCVCSSASLSWEVNNSNEKTFAWTFLFFIGWVDQFWKKKKSKCFFLSPSSQSFQVSQTNYDFKQSSSYNMELKQKRRQRQRKPHLKINIWKMVTSLWLLRLLPRILYCWQSTLQMDW